MKLFLDTEFNGFKGELISLALVSECGREFYQVLRIPAKRPEWVSRNVIGYLPIEDHDGKPVGEDIFSDLLAHYLLQFPNAVIIADWPADIEHLCAAMTYQGSRAGWRIPGEFTFKLVRCAGCNPAIPHNALSDARALKEAYLRGNNEHAGTDKAIH
jgi:hypothetical protein